MRRHEQLAVVTAAVLALGACDALDPTSFDRLRQTSEIVVSGSPGGGTGSTGFGAVLLGFGTTLPDSVTPTRLVRASRYAASSGSGGAYSVFPAFDEGILDQRSTTGLYPSATAGPRYNGCVNAQFCGVGSSISFAAAAMWRQDAATTRFGCVIVPSGNAIVDSRAGEHHEQVQIRCEPTSTQIQPIDVPVERVEFGASATSLPVDHPLGAVIFGAPGDQSGDGALFLLDDYPVSGFTRIGLTGVPVGAGLGRTLASVALADGTILLATGGRGRPDDPVVVVATLDPAGGAAVVRACLRGRGTRFGSALTFGNFDGDAIPDLVIGAGVWASEDIGSQHVDQPLALYSGGQLVNGRAQGCEDPPSTTLAPARMIACENDARAGFTCAASSNDTYVGFGASLATGDINGDGRDDLIVGAPLANIRAAGAGAVEVLAGGTSFDAIGTSDHSFLTYSSIGAGARLGAAVATVPGVDRSEIVSGAPGNGRVAIFFCSGLRGDRPEDFTGMTGITHGCVLGPRSRADVDAGTIAPSDAGVRMDAGDDADVDAGDAGDDAGTMNDAGDDADVDADTDAG
jgi:hypothetical protein